jgi:phosphoglycolate phosphatase
MSALRLVIFDVDGTLVDSQGDIVASMEAAFAAENLGPPPRESILSIVGLSLDHAMARIAPEQFDAARRRMVEAYKDSYAALRRRGGVASSPFYPGAEETLLALGSDDWTLLGVATGKSRRGLNALLDSHGIAAHFDTLQVADDHPSKPHPSMLMACLSETGVPADRAVFVGDTTYDMEMGRAAGVATIAVTWGYHKADDLRACEPDAMIDDFSALPRAVERVLQAS